MQQLFTRWEAEAIMRALAKLVCYRCRRSYSQHAEADHYFFDAAEDVVPEESN
jgi:hypothetical protein